MSFFSGKMIGECVGTTPVAWSPTREYICWYASSTTTKGQFTSYKRDAECTLDYALFRYDSSRLGRFMTTDPVAGSVTNPQSLNRYAYVLDDPINLVDPLGLECVLWITYQEGYEGRRWSECRMWIPGHTGPWPLFPLDPVPIDRPHRGGTGPGPTGDDRTARVHRCAARQANRVSAAQLLGGGPVANLFLGNDLSSLSGIITGPERDQAALNLKASQAAINPSLGVPANAARLAGNVATNDPLIMLNVGSGTAATGNIWPTALSETALGNVASRALSGALNAFTGYKALWDITTYYEALVYCARTEP